MGITNKLLTEYAPEDVKVAWNGIDITGFGPDSFIRFERAVDGFGKTVGADGTVARTRNADRTGVVTITLMQNSLSNRLLAAAAAADELGGEVISNFTVNDPSGSGLAVAFDAWLRKAPDQDYAAEYGTREWVFDCAYLQIIAAS